MLRPNPPRSGFFFAFRFVALLQHYVITLQRITLLHYSITLQCNYGYNYDVVCNCVCYVIRLKMAIKKDDVFRVADEMFADGVSPSLVGIRSALGSGSFSTISGFLAEWKSSTRTAPVVGVEDVPDEVQDCFAPALRSMWAIAQAHALQENEKIQKDTAVLLALAAGREAEALELAQLVQSENDLLINKSLALRGELDEMKDAYHGLERVVSACKSREHELRLQHNSLLAKIRPISVRKDRGVVAAVKVK